MHATMSLYNVIVCLCICIRGRVENFIFVEIKLTTNMYPLLNIWCDMYHQHNIHHHH